MAVVVRQPAFGAVLNRLLLEWRYAATEDFLSADLLLVEEGCSPPLSEGTLRWLMRSSGDGAHLPLPLPLENLWIALSAHFHSPLRRHIRLPMHYPATVLARNRSHASLMTSLSEMGGRFDLGQELGTGEEVVILLNAGGEEISLAGKIIYVIDPQELGGNRPVEIGVVFDRTDPPRRRRLQELIIAALFERIRLHLEPGVYRQGLAGFRLPANSLQDNYLAFFHHPVKS